LAETADHEDDLVTRLYVKEGYRLADIAAAAIRLLRAGELARPIEPISEVHERARGRGRKRGRGSRRSGNRRPSQGSGTQEPGMVRLVMDAGKAQGIRPRDVVGAIAGETGIAGSAIGAIDIQQRQTFVDIKEQHVGKVLYKMQGRHLRGQSVTLSRAR
jgi:ATP-dependent RNA helicase DeaD